MTWDFEGYPHPVPSRDRSLQQNLQIARYNDMLRQWVCYGHLLNTAEKKVWLKLVPHIYAESAHCDVGPFLDEPSWATIVAARILWGVEHIKKSAFWARAQAAYPRANLRLEHPNSDGPTPLDASPDDVHHWTRDPIGINPWEIHRLQSPQTMRWHGRNPTPGGKPYAPEQLPPSQTPVEASLSVAGVQEAPSHTEVIINQSSATDESRALTGQEAPSHSKVTISQNSATDESRAVPIQPKSQLPSTGTDTPLSPVSDTDPRAGHNMGEAQDTNTSGRKRKWEFEQNESNKRQKTAETRTIMESKLDAYQEEVQSLKIRVTGLESTQTQYEIQIQALWQQIHNLHRSNERHENEIRSLTARNRILEIRTATDRSFSTRYTTARDSSTQTGVEEDDAETDDEEDGAETGVKSWATRVLGSWTL